MYWIIEEIKLAKNENKYSSCKVYSVFMIIVFTIFTEITIYFVYYNWSWIESNVSCKKFSTRKERKIWWMNIKLGEIKKKHIKNRTYYFYNVS